MKKSKKLKETVDRREYKFLTTIDQDPYREDYWSAHRRRKFTSKEGSKNYSRRNRKIIYKFQYRAYRNWKYNRNTQWKV